MKKYIYPVLFLFINSAFAQSNESGIYKTAQDYKDGKLAYAFNCDSSKEKIKIHHFFYRNYIDIVNFDNKIKLYKDSIFGYRNCGSESFRFYHSGETEYQILENLSIVLYISEIQVRSFPTDKTFEIEPAYFFSIGLYDSILPLSLLNLKRAFPDNMRFHDLLDLTFGDGSPVSTYDMEHKMYKINYLFTVIK